MKAIAVSVLVATTTLFGSVGQAAPAFVNGSLSGPNDELSLVPPGWDTLSPTPDTEGEDGPHEPYNLSPDGGTFVAGAHATTQAPLGFEGIQQTLTDLTVGQHYRVTFYQSNLGFGPDNIGGTWGAVANWQLYLDAQPADLFSANMAPEEGALPNNSWSESFIDFTAAATTHAVGFGPHSVSGENAFLGIDGIQIAAVPVPAAGCLLVSAVGAIVFSVKRRAPQIRT